MEISEVKQALADAVSGIAGLNCYGYSPSAPSVPFFSVGEVVLDPNQTFGGSDVAEFTCRVCTSAADDRDGQLLLDQLLSRSGAMSVRAALFAARGLPGQEALDGAADDVVVLRIDGYREIQYGNNESFFGAEITVRVIGS